MSKYDELKRLAAELALEVPALLREKAGLIAENERLEAELRAKELAYAADAIAYRCVVYRVQRERAGTEIGPAGLQRMFLLGYNRSATLLQTMLERGDLAPIDGKPHCGWVHGGNDEDAEEAAK